MLFKHNKALNKIVIQTKKAVYGNNIGNNSSIFKGEGFDFSELREYQDGEDVKKIDWVISAKLQKPFVKVFHSQKELNINIISLLGGSMYFGSSRLKQDVLCECVATIGFLALKQKDPYANFVFHNTLVPLHKKTKKSSHLYKTLETLFSYKSIGKMVDYTNLNHAINQHIQQKSILFLIGDFLECDIQSLGLKSLAKKHEVVALVVRDKIEEHPKQLGNVNLIDPSTQKTFEGNINASVIQEYTKKIKAHDTELFDYFRKANITFSKIYTHENATIKLIKLFLR